MNDIVRQNTFSLTPTTFDEALKYADIMAKSSIIPKSYQGKPGDILIAVQMGADLGLKPVQALQSIAVINGKPSIYGDSLLALVQCHPQFEDIQEYFDEKAQAAVCIVKRRNQSMHKSVYSIEDAKRAGLWGKPGPWTQYPRRMLQMRARGFALRDRFADALGGLITVEEAQDYPKEVNSVEAPAAKTKTESVLSKLNVIHTQQEAVIIDEPEDQIIEATIEEEEQTPYQTLVEMIAAYDIPDEVVSKWCERGNVTELSDLSLDHINACIEFIKMRYHLNK